MTRFDCYGCEIGYEQCDNPECENGDVLDAQENVMECDRCKGLGGWFQGVAMSREEYDKLDRREDADHFATTYPETA